MIDREHDLSITKQAAALNISRGSVYYLSRPVSASDLEVMRRLDGLHLQFPFAGSRMLRSLLAAEGYKIGRRHVKRLMKRMGIEALYRRPRTTKSEPGHKVYPYLLRDLEITRPNQVWAMDITYIPMARGFVYLAVVLDWFSRRLLAWRLSVTMEASFCVEALEDALALTANPRSSIPIRALSSPAWPSPASSLSKASPSAWMAKAPGGTMCSSNGCGAPSNTRRYTYGPMRASAMHALRSAAICASTMSDARMRALTA
jgi:putative transposase